MYEADLKHNLCLDRFCPKRSIGPSCFFALALVNSTHSLLIEINGLPTANFALSPGYQQKVAKFKLYIKDRLR